MPSSFFTAPTEAAEEVENIPLSRPPVACVVPAADEVSGRARSPSFSVRVMMLVFRSSVKSVT